MAETWSVLKVLRWTSDHFTKKGIDSPRLAAEILLAHVLGCTRVKLYMDFDRPLAQRELAAYRALIERRIAGEPTAYLTGVREFYGRPFKVDARVLIPRPETERLVERVLGALPADRPAEILDLCTGSGCVAATIAAERPQVRVTAVDLSPDALEVARENVAALGVADRVRLLQGDLFEPVAGRRFDAVASNPPYVAEDELARLPREVQREPRLALSAGPRGLAVIERIAAAAPAHLVPGGLIALEIGEDQRGAVQKLLAERGFTEVVVHPDWAGRDRIAVARA